MIGFFRNGMPLLVLVLFLLTMGLITYWDKDITHDDIDERFDYANISSHISPNSAYAHISYNSEDNIILKLVWIVPAVALKFADIALLLVIGLSNVFSHYILDNKNWLNIPLLYILFVIWLGYVWFRDMILGLVYAGVSAYKKKKEDYSNKNKEEKKKQIRKDLIICGIFFIGFVIYLLSMLGGLIWN